MRRLGCILFLGLCFSPFASAQTTAPTTRPELTKEQQVAQLFDYLNDQYAKLLKSPDWIERSLACISLAKIPGNRATDQLLGVTRSDPRQRPR